MACHFFVVFLLDLAPSNLFTQPQLHNFHLSKLFLCNEVFSIKKCILIFVNDLTIAPRTQRFSVVPSTVGVLSGLYLFKENLSFTCFWMFVYIQHSFLHHADCPKSDRSVNGKPQGALEVEFKLLRCDCKLSLLFVPHSRSLPESFLSG